MKDITLLNPELKLDYPLMDTIKNRRTIRKISDEILPLKEISNILWVACGETKIATNRSKNRRTIPSACNSQKVSIYVTLREGIFKYIECNHSLIQISEIDIRSEIVNQKFLKNAPLGIIYVGKHSGISGIIKHDDHMENLLIGTEVGAMSQNVYLYCTAAKLNTVLVGLISRDTIREHLKLKESEKVVFTQVVGFKKSKIE